MPLPVAALDALIGCCKVTDCRRRQLLAYFGDDFTEPCCNCDNCLRLHATWGVSEAAQKLLSAVYRTGQHFGAAHVVDVLLVTDTDKIRQLIVQGFLRADRRRYGAPWYSPG